MTKLRLKPRLPHDILLLETTNPYRLINTYL